MFPRAGCPEAGGALRSSSPFPFAEERPGWLLQRVHKQDIQSGKAPDGGYNNCFSGILPRR